jgi:ATP-dependent helicase/nuclease subunit A
LENDDSYIIIDYKTDSVKNLQELKERYLFQMSLYKTAVENIYKKPVLKVFIWSFALSDYIEMYNDD